MLKFQKIDPSFVLAGVVVVTGITGAALMAQPADIKPGPPGTTTTVTTVTRTTTVTVTPVQTKPVIQIALLLDTSSSMDGLIGQAKLQLWKVVADLAYARHAGEKPRLEVALYHYGTPSLGESTGYVKQLLPFTDDLDLVSEKLFALTTNGGSEYCGTVIQSALKELSWSDKPAAYKAVFIAGNEPFNQGQVDFRQACELAVDRKVRINTIFCGMQSEGVATLWKEGADIGKGSYASINQNQAIVEVKTPFDDEFTKLNAKLNTTYIPYGQQGFQSQRRQESADSRSSAQMSQRAGAKASSLYSNTSWDAVDARKAGAKVEEMDAAYLPENMKKMTPAERVAYVEKVGQERTQIQKEILELSRKRQEYIAKNAKETPGNDTLGAALTGAVREQAKTAGYVFEEPK